MCDSLSEGGRRCPSCYPPLRSARDRARYAMKKAAGSSAGAPDHVGPEYVPPAGEILTPRETRQRGEQVAALVLAGDPDAHHELAAWAGNPVNAISRVGASIANEAERAAGVEAAEISEALGDRRTASNERISSIFALVPIESRRMQEAQQDLGFLEAQQELVDQSQGKLHIGGLSAKLREARERHLRAGRDLYDAGERYGLREAIAHGQLLLEAEDDDTQSGLALLASGYRASLAQHVSLGGVQHQWHSSSDPAASRALDQVAECYPTTWVAASTAGYAVHAVLAPDRGAYSDAVLGWRVGRSTRLPAGQVPPDSGLYVWVEDSRAQTADSSLWHEVEMEFHTDSSGAFTMSSTRPEGEEWEPYGGTNGQPPAWRRPAAELREPPRIIVTAGSEGRAAVHEFGHRVESVVPGLGLAQEAFVRRRTLLPDGSQQRPVPMYPGQADPELVRPDRFVTPYIGRDYGSQIHHEVLSTGVEALFGGRFGGLVAGRSGGPDLDHRGFVLGLMMSLPAEVSPGRRRV